MLKIYLRTVKHVIRSADDEYPTYCSKRYVIEDEDAAKPSTAEVSIYEDTIEKVGYWYMKYKCKKGFKVLVAASDGILTFKQWKDPDAKLVETITYEERSCAMNQLFELPADKVIAYLRQEGVNLLVSP